MTPRGASLAGHQSVQATRPESFCVSSNSFGVSSNSFCVSSKSFSVSSKSFCVSSNSFCVSSKSLQRSKIAPQWPRSREPDGRSRCPVLRAFSARNGHRIVSASRRTGDHRRKGWRSSARPLSRSRRRHPSPADDAAGRSRRAHALSTRRVGRARQAPDGGHREDRPVPRSDHRHSQGRRLLDTEREPPAPGTEEARISRGHRDPCTGPGRRVQDPRAQHGESAQPAREVARDDPHGPRAGRFKRPRPRRVSRSSSSRRRS